MKHRVIVSSFGDRGIHTQPFCSKCKQISGNIPVLIKEDSNLEADDLHFKVFDYKKALGSLL